MELARSSRPGSPPPEGFGSPDSVRSGSSGLPRSLHDLLLSPGWPSRSSAPCPAGTDREIVSVASCSSALLQSHLSALGVPLLSWDSSTSASPPEFTSGVHSQEP
jgi:hypothetical protein